MALPALGALEEAAKAVQRAAKALEASPTHEGQLRDTLEEIVGALYNLEVQAHADLQQRIRRPMPAPNPSEVGSWASSLRQNRAALAPIMSLSPPQWIMDAAGQIRAAAGHVLEAISRPPIMPPEEPVMEPAPTPHAAPQGFGNPAGFVAAGAAVAGVAGGAATSAAATKKVLGIAMQVAAAAGSALMGYGLHRWEKKQRNEGLAVDEDEEPFNVKNRSQKLLDSELPGTALSLVPAPDGEWIASVKRGSEIVSRVPGRKPHAAAADAIKRALEYEEAKRHDVEGEIIGHTIDVTEKARRL